MKYIRFILIFIIVFFLSFFNVYALEASLKDVSIEETSDTIKVERPTLRNKTIYSSIVFINEGDFVTYRLVLDFDATVYHIESIKDDNNNRYVKTNYRFNKNIVFVTVSYEEETNGSLNLGDIEITINIEDEKGNVEPLTVNPKTENKYPIGYLLFIVTSLCLLLFLRNKKNTMKTMIILLFFPVLVFAKEVFSVKLSLENTKIGYVIKFNKDSDVEGSLKNIICYVGEDCELPENTLEKSGYVFKGWSTTENGPVEFENAEEVYNLSNGGSVNLYPVWAALFDIYYDGNGYTSGSTSSNTCVSGDDCTLSYNGFSKTGYTFAGWSTSSGGSVMYTNGETVVMNIDSGYTYLYAKWTPNTYTISFNGNGSTSGSTSSVTCTYDTYCTLPSNGFSKTDANFLGWSTSTSGSIQYNNGGSVFNLVTSGSITLYAKWDDELILDFSYTGSVQTFTTGKSGNYKLEVWGAQGGSSLGGKGGYSYGTIYLNSGITLYVYVGQVGKASSTSSAFNGGGGGAAYTYTGSSGGGATDISIRNGNWNSSDHLYSRVIVAGGGGGSTNISGSYVNAGGYGGGTSGGNGSFQSSSCFFVSYGGGQTSGGSGATQCDNGTGGNSGTFGIGANGMSSSDQNYWSSGGGGGGWYGGGSGSQGGNAVSGGGGSGYVYTSSTVSNYPSGCLLNSSYYLTDAETIAGNTSFTSPDGNYETGHSGNGYARITYLGN